MRITMLAVRTRPGRAADIVSGFRMIQAGLRTDCKSSGKVSTGNATGTADSAIAAVRRAPRVGSEMRARRVHRVRPVIAVRPRPDDVRFVASATRRWQSRTLDKLGSTVTI